MSRVVLDVSMSLDGLIAGPNVREAEPMGDAANAYTHGWPGMGPTPRSTSACAEKWTRPLAPRSSGGARYMITSHATPLSGRLSLHVALENSRPQWQRPSAPARRS